MSIIFIIWCVCALVALALYLRQTYSVLSRRGVRGALPLPFLGNMGKVLTRFEHFADLITSNYTRYPEDRFVGSYEFMNPVVVVRDLELIKKISIKDFDHFVDHRSIIDEKNDPLFGSNLFFLKGNKWRDMRSTLSPAFTSSKIKLMVPFMVEVGDQMVKTLKDKIKKAGGSLDVENKDLTARFANDVIASCAFGLKVDSHSDPDNEFFAKGKEAASFKYRQLILFFLSASFPKLMNILKINFLPESTQNFFRRLVLDTMQDRETRHVVRPDMIHLLMEVKKGNLSHEEHAIDEGTGFATVDESSVGKRKVTRVWSDDDLIAQAVLFFIAGFDGISSAMSFLLHELAVNPDVQEKLVREIKEYDQRNNGQFDFNSIQQMTYMDMVVSEVLRLWPTGVQMDRGCNMDYNMGKPNKYAKEDFILRKGEGMSIPVWAIHRDPQYFPDPLKFDPERFSEENKHSINPFAYMPFGLGPRNCIGSRFALCEVKALAYQLLRAFQISPCKKTQIPVVLEKDTFNLRIQGGHWVKFRERQ